MIELLSKKIADFIIAQNADEAENRDVLIYGNTLVISDLVSIIVILIIGLVFDRLICSFLFFSLCHYAGTNQWISCPYPLRV